MQGNGKRIRTSDVTIKTAAIEIKALTISKRQVTQSVFRQLLHEQVVDEPTLQLKGPVWGHVNYFWGDDAKRTDDALHVVWQKDDELRRAVVPKDLGAFPFWAERKSRLDAYFKGMVLLGVVEDTVDVSPFPRDEFSMEIAGREVRYLLWYGDRVRIHNDIQTILDARDCDDTGKTQPYWLKERAAEAKARLISEANEMYVMGSFDEARRYAEQRADELNDAEARWPSIWESLLATDHLFIAA